MINKKWLLATFPVIVAALAVVLYSSNKPETKGVVPTHAQQIAPDAAAATAATAPVTDADNLPQSFPAQSLPDGTNNSWTTSREVIAGQEASDKVSFKVDHKGHIVTDEEARLNIEKLFALNSHEQRAKKLQDIEASLPSAAARELADLMDHYDSYQIAQRQVLPPGEELASVDVGTTQIDMLHGLRVQYFGPTVAEGFFGAEERIQRELLQLMSLEKDQSMTMEEKAARAQTLYKALPALAAAEERGKAEAGVAHP